MLTRHQKIVLKGLLRKEIRQAQKLKVDDEDTDVYEQYVKPLYEIADYHEIQLAPSLGFSKIIFCSKCDNNIVEVEGEVCKKCSKRTTNRCCGFSIASLSPHCS